MLFKSFIIGSIYHSYNVLKTASTNEHSPLNRKQYWFDGRKPNINMRYKMRNYSRLNEETSVRVGNYFRSIRKRYNKMP